MKPTVYIETSIISCLTARPSNDVRVAACQNITTEWWEKQRENFELYISEFVIVEAARGDKNEAKLRLAALKELTQLKVTEEAKILAHKFITEGALPAKAKIDAFHVAVAVTSGIEYLLTWNCTHAAEHNHNIDTIFQDILEREKLSKKKIVVMPARKIVPLNNSKEC